MLKPPFGVVSLEGGMRLVDNPIYEPLQIQVLVNPVTRLCGEAFTNRAKILVGWANNIQRDDGGVGGTKSDEINAWRPLDMLHVTHRVRHIQHLSSALYVCLSFVYKMIMIYYLRS